jgi:CBS domain containing-hemolysin-like protein
VAEIEQTKIIVRKMTKAQIINLGGTAFINTKKVTWLAAFIIALIFGIIVQAFYKHTMVTGILSVAPVVAVFIGFFYTINKAGKKFWEKIKDIPEPVDMSKFLK